MSTMPDFPVTPENDRYPVDDAFDPDDRDDGDYCGRWDNGRLAGSCLMAGTAFCDFECPFRDEP